MRLCLHTTREVGPESIGGTERILVEWCRELNALGHDAFILCSGVRGVTDIAGVEVVQHLPQPLRRPYLRYRSANTRFLLNEVLGGKVDSNALKQLGGYVDQQLEGHQFDGLVFNSIFDGVHSRFVANTILVQHENPQEIERKWGDVSLKTLIENVGEYDALLTAKAIAVPSQHYAHKFTSILKRNVVQLPLGISLEHFSRRRRRIAYRRSRNGRELKLLLPSRFDPIQKGHDVALEATAMLNEEGVDTHLTVTGMRQDYHDRLQPFLARVRNLDLIHKVEIKRFVDIQDAFATCDVVISPERYCSFGLSVAESLSLGIPTALSNIPTYAEIASGFKHAEFAAPDSPGTFVEAIKRLQNLDPAVCDSEAIRFRLKYDLRHSALELHNLLTSTSRSNSVL